MSGRRNIKHGSLVALKQSVDTPERSVKSTRLKIEKDNKRQMSVRTENALTHLTETKATPADFKFRVSVLRSATSLCVLLLASGALCIVCNSPHTQIVWDVIKFAVGAVIGLFSGIGIAKGASTK